MLNKQTIILFFSLLVVLGFSCSPKNISTKYYYENEKVLDSIEESYKELYPHAPFNIGFTARDFNTISLEIITDTLSYIYEFTLNEKRFTDTLLKYKFNASKVVELVQQMHDIRCAWIDYYDYYVDTKKNELIFMSIKPVALKRPFAYSKYYVLAYYPQPQYFDSEGRLLHKRKLNELRKLNGEIFRRINSKVCYTISGRFR
ncbi:MAG: hypothetical protein ABI685_00650 [Ferruginibacter sp.]